MPRTTKQPRDVDIYAGERIRALRIAKGLSQTQLGAMLGVSFQQVQKYEKGANRISVGNIMRISRFLQAPVTAFFPPTDPDSHPDIDDPCHELGQTQCGLRLARAFVVIDSDEVKEALTRVVEATADANSFAVVVTPHHPKQENEAALVTEGR